MVGLVHSLSATLQILPRGCICVKQGEASLRCSAGLKTISSSFSAGAIISSLREQISVDTC